MVNLGEKCCGCSACSEVCVHKCIQMKLEDEGFFYPYIDKNKCVNCGLCEKVCPVLNVGNKINDNPIILLGANKDKKQRTNSSSGGIFILLAKHVLEQDGFVCGAVLSDDMYSVEHIISNELSCL